MGLDTEIGCAGLIGFGAGYAFGKEHATPGEIKTLPLSENYCAAMCSVSRICLERHVIKCRLMFPVATKSFDALVAKEGQEKATRLWREWHPSSPFEPYQTQLLANMRMGYEAAETGNVTAKILGAVKFENGKVAA